MIVLSGWSKSTLTSIGVAIKNRIRIGWEAQLRKQPGTQFSIFSILIADRLASVDIYSLNYDRFFRAGKECIPSTIISNWCNRWSELVFAQWSTPWGFSGSTSLCLVLYGIGNHFNTKTNEALVLSCQWSLCQWHFCGYVPRAERTVSIPSTIGTWPYDRGRYIWCTSSHTGYLPYCLTRLHGKELNGRPWKLAPPRRRHSDLWLCGEQTKRPAQNNGIQLAARCIYLTFPLLNAKRHQQSGLDTGAGVRYQHRLWLWNS